MHLPGLESVDAIQLSNLAIVCHRLQSFPPFFPPVSVFASVDSQPNAGISCLGSKRSVCLSATTDVDTIEKGRWWWGEAAKGRGGRGMCVCENARAPHELKRDRGGTRTERAHTCPLSTSSQRARACALRVCVCVCVRACVRAPGRPRIPSHGRSLDSSLPFPSFFLFFL